MLALRFHAPAGCRIIAGDRPGLSLPVHLIPPCLPRLGRANGRQDQELEGELGDGGDLAVAELLDKGRYFRVRQGGMVTLGLFLAGQRLADQGHGIVAGAEAGRARPFKHRGNPLPHVPRGRRLDVPDRGEDFQNVGRGDIADRHVPDDGEGVIPQRINPLVDMLAVAPTLRPLPVHLLGRILKGRHA